MKEEHFTRLKEGFFTAQELAAWFPFFASTSKMLTRLDSEVKRSNGLSLLDFHLMLHLASDSDHRARMSDLAEVTGSDPSTITYRITRLEKHGWVERDRVDEDRRGVFARVTETGIEKVAAATINHVATVRREFLSKYTAEQLEQIDALFGILATSLGLPPHPHGELVDELEATL